MVMRVLRFMSFPLVETGSRVIRTTLAAILSCLLVFPPEAWAGSVSWTGNGGSGQWSDPSNWTCQGSCGGFTYPTNTLPPGANSVSIDPAGLSTANLDVTATINTLSLGTNGTLNIAGAGRSLTVAGALTQSGGSLNVDGGARIAAGGLANNGGSLRLMNNSVADFRTGGTGTFANLDGATGVLSGGDSGAAYAVNGRLYYDAANGVNGGNILELQQANLTLSGGGQFLYGGNPGALGGTNGLAMLTRTTNSSVTLDGTSLAVNPNGGALGMSYNSFNGMALNLRNAASLSVNGDLAVTFGRAFSGALAMSGSSLAVSGAISVIRSGYGADFFSASASLDASSIVAGGSFSLLSLPSSDTPILELNNSSSFVAKGLSNGGMIRVNDTSVADFRAGGNNTFTSLSSSGVLSGRYDLTGQLLFDPTSGPGGGKILSNSGGLTLNGTGAHLLYGPSAADALTDLASNTGRLSYLNGASLVTSGNFDNFGDLTLSGGTHAIGGIFQNGGSVEFGGELTTLSHAFVNDGQADIGGGLTTSPGFTNNGTLTLSGGTFDARGGAFANLNSQGVLSGGQYRIGSGGMFVFDGGPITGGGTGTSVHFGGSGSGFFRSGEGLGNEAFLVRQINGSLAFDFANRTLTPLGGALSIGSSGTMVVDSLSTVQVAGSITNNNYVESWLSSQLSLDGFLDNHGVVSVSAQSGLSASSLTNSGTLFVRNQSVLNIRAGMLVNQAGGSVSIFNSATASALGLSNSGSLVVEGGSSAAFQGGTFTNLDGAGTLSGGSYIVGGTMTYNGAQGTIQKIGANTSLALDAQNSGLHTILAGNVDAISGLSNNAGNLTVRNGVSLNLTPAGGTFTNTGVVTTESPDNGQINTIHVAGDFHNVGGGVLNLNNSGDSITATGQFINDSTINLNGDNTFIHSDGALINTGVINYHGANTTATGGPFQNVGGITVGSGTALVLQNTATNSGSVTVAGGGSLTVQNGNSYIQTAGITEVAAGGTLSAANVVLQGGTLAGFGTINGSVQNVSGTVAPGDPGTMTISSNFTQQAAGMLILQFASDALFDELLIGGNVNLNGTLRIDLLSGFAPTLGEHFRILSWGGTRTGNFGTFLFPTFGGLTFSETLNANDITLSVISAGSGNSNAPEPGTFGAGLGGLILALICVVRARRCRREFLRPGLADS